MKYITAMFVFLGIWFLASFINGVLSGTCLSLYGSEKFDNATFGLAMFFSFVFSVPLVGVVWLVTIAAQLNGTKGFALFKTVVIAAMFCSIAGAVLFVVVFSREFKEASYLVGLSIILSAITSVTIFRNHFKAYEETI